MNNMGHITEENTNKPQQNDIINEASHARKSPPNSEDDIAIIGIGCRLPGAINSANEFWNFLAAGRSAISEIPSTRWSLDQHYHPDPDHPLTQHVKHGGFLADIDQFDASFFGISPRETRTGSEWKGNR